MLVSSPNNLPKVSVIVCKVVVEGARTLDI